MKAGTYIPRSVGLVALVIVSAVGGLCASKKSRMFNARFEVVWAGAVDVAKDAFLLDKTSKEDGRLLFRTGLVRGYRFEVQIVNAGAGKTRAVVELQTNYSAVKKEAWRGGDRYLTLVAQRVQQGGRK